MVPWRSLKGIIRDVEFCKVKDLVYSTHPGSGESCCKMTLQFVDPTSNVVGKSFKLTLPEITGLPDFLVERSRYDAAMKKNWSNRDKCQVWWKNEGEEDGSWWHGRVVAVKPKSVDFPDSPWERFSVHYKNDPNVFRHSPWELIDSSIVWEEPHIDDDVRNKLIRALSKLEQSGNKSKVSSFLFLYIVLLRILNSTYILDFKRTLSFAIYRQIFGIIYRKVLFLLK